MLTEVEWAELLPALEASVVEIQDRRRANGWSLAEAIAEPYGELALEVHERITGERPTSVEPLWHHEAARLGPPCTSCGKPLRTKKARVCVSCGTPRA